MSYTKQHEADSYRAHAAWIEDNSTRIQARSRISFDDDDWTDKDTVASTYFDHDNLLFRIKPAPKFRAWTAYEVPKEPFFVRSKTGELVAVSTSYTKAFRLVVDGDLEALFRNYTKLDGSPCGVEVKEGE